MVLVKLLEDELGLVIVLCELEGARADKIGTGAPGAPRLREQRPLQDLFLRAARDRAEAPREPRPPRLLGNTRAALTVRRPSFFSTLGTPVEGVMTDNSSGYRSGGGVSMVDKTIETPARRPGNIATEYRPKRQATDWEMSEASPKAPLSLPLP